MAIAQKRIWVIKTRIEYIDPKKPPVLSPFVRRVAADGFSEAISFLNAEERERIVSVKCLNKDIEYYNDEGRD